MTRRKVNEIGLPLVARRWSRIDEFSVTPVSLEDVYITLVGSEGGHGSVAA